MFLNRIFLVLILLASGNIVIFSQKGNPPPVGHHLNKDHELAIRNLDSLSGTYRFLANGEIYFPHQQGARNHPFFINEAWNKGSVTIENRTFNNCLLRYDICKDQLILLSIQEGAKSIVLNEEFIESFEIIDQRFIYLAKFKNGNENQLPEGFYNVVYEGLKSNLYIKWTKFRVKNDGLRQDEFELRKKIYLTGIRGINHIKNNRQLISALSGKKKELKRFMRKNSIRVKTSSPEELAKVIVFQETSEAK